MLDIDIDVDCLDIDIRHRRWCRS